ncbi:putative metal-dependent HD superfamily phosphohydrolase [Hamadaea flava]|uniref:Metal-dependent phosphohydrolase n=1 Tax=Hamadaea flava TaxID=1742688 RepID=A0ABV8M1N5_9ACTN|nr:metal-dependent phosphohydrolase [Hamadaea flava]MCP2325745.1 putative metal-dependent HD superfamily phosphohydrolase [Hamadaea flava]
MDLTGHFRSSVIAAGGRPDDAVAADLLARWSEPHRHYHTVDHLRFMLAVIDEHAAFADDPDLVRLAAWGHDAIYDPRSAGNEEASAILSAELLDRCELPDPAVAEVARLVRLTAGHTVEPGDRNGALLADADLAVLARDWPSYLEYAAAVRAEYAHVPDDAFRSGRAAVLRSLLDLPALFRIPALAESWEEKARANLTRELASLTT